MNATITSLTMAVSMLSALLLILMPQASPPMPPGPWVDPWAAGWGLAVLAGAAMLTGWGRICLRGWRGRP